MLKKFKVSFKVTEIYLQFYSIIRFAPLPQHLLSKTTNEVLKYRISSPSSVQVQMSTLKVNILRHVGGFIFDQKIVKICKLSDLSVPDPN